MAENLFIKKIRERREAQRARDRRRQDNRIARGVRSGRIRVSGGDPIPEQKKTRRGIVIKSVVRSKSERKKNNAFITKPETKRSSTPKPASVKAKSSGVQAFGISGAQDDIGIVVPRAKTPVKKPAPAIIKTPVKKPVETVTPAKPKGTPISQKALDQDTKTRGGTFQKSVDAKLDELARDLGNSPAAIKRELDKFSEAEAKRLGLEFSGKDKKDYLDGVEDFAKSQRELLVSNLVTVTGANRVSDLSPGGLQNATFKQIIKGVVSGEIDPSNLGRLSGKGETVTVLKPAELAAFVDSKEKFDAIKLTPSQSKTLSILQNHSETLDTLQTKGAKGRLRDITNDALKDATTDTEYVKTLVSLRWDKEVREFVRDPKGGTDAALEIGFKYLSQVEDDRIFRTSQSGAVPLPTPPAVLIRAIGQGIAKLKASGQAINKTNLQKVIANARNTKFKVTPGATVGSGPVLPKVRVITIARPAPLVTPVKPHRPAGTPATPRGAPARQTTPLVFEPKPKPGPAPRPKTITTQRKPLNPSQLDVKVKPKTAITAKQAKIKPRLLPRNPETGLFTKSKLKPSPGGTSGSGKPGANQTGVGKPGTPTKPAPTSDGGLLKKRVIRTRSIFSNPEAAEGFDFKEFGSGVGDPETKSTISPGSAKTEATAKTTTSKLKPTTTTNLKPGAGTKTELKPSTTTTTTLKPSTDTNLTPGLTPAKADAPAPVVVPAKADAPAPAPTKPDVPAKPKAKKPPGKPSPKPRPGPKPPAPKPKPDPTPGPKPRKDTPELPEPIRAKIAQQAAIGLSPRVVTWVQGVSRVTLDLQTNKRTHSAVSPELRTKTPVQTFRVVRFGRVKVPNRSFKLGKVVVVTSTRGLKFRGL